MNEQAYRSALTGLLHDIGKVAVRAGERGGRIWDDEARRDFSYFHALRTADFVDRCTPEPWRAEVKNLAGNHHRPHGQPERVITLADHLSAGERADPSGAADLRAAQPQQLLSIFCSLRADEQEAPRPLYLPLAPLRIAKEVLRPGAEQKEEEQTRRAYVALRDAFRREAEALRNAHRDAPDLPAFLESLLLLMQRYLWCVPSAYYRARPDVSLLDHSRMTAALAAILADSDLADARWEALTRAPQDADDEICLLVGGDVSGVQEFIYRITDPDGARVLVKWADQLGQELKNAGLTTSQIRALVGEVRQIQAQWSMGEETRKKAARRLILLKPKMAYRARREREQTVKDLVNVLQPALDEVVQEKDARKQDGHFHASSSSSRRSWPRKDASS